MKRTYLIILLTIALYLGINVYFHHSDVAVNKNLTLNGVSVVIDPGHGGTQLRK